MAQVRLARDDSIPRFCVAYVPFPPVLSFAVLCFAQTNDVPSSYFTDPLNGSWLSLNVVTPQQRNVVYACFIMSANLGGLVGSEIMRASDAPRALLLPFLNAFSFHTN